MGHIGYIKPGEYNATCDVCGVWWKSGDMRERWDHAMCCPFCWEPRNRQDFIRGIPDNQALPWSRPDPPPIYVMLDEPLRLVDSFRVGQQTIG